MTEAASRTFAIFVEDKPGVLNRVASLFRRRSFNIHSLNVSTTHEPGVSRMTVVCEADGDTAKRIEANLYKLVNVLWVDDITHAPTVERALALIKVRVGRDARAEVLRVCEVFGARPVDLSLETMTVEMTGPEDHIQSLVDVLRPFEILEMVQTGAVAMTRGSVERAQSHPTIPARRTHAA
ncbi:MAG: acetolactate synthase small subunit [Myxococcales bacterium]|nr:acetolactate synthase small subunit [Myxococcales bacterium]